MHQPPRPTLFPTRRSSDLVAPRAVKAGDEPRKSLEQGQREPELAGLGARVAEGLVHFQRTDRKSTRLNSSHSQISYAVFCLKKKNPDEPTGKTITNLFEAV